VPDVSRNVVAPARWQRLGQLLPRIQVTNQVIG